MNCKSMIVLCAAIILCVLAGVQAEEENVHSETKPVLNVAEDPSRAITAYDYKALMLRSVGKAFQCWRCSYPCSSYACCNDGYPQCCLVNGLYCMCCRA